MVPETPATGAADFNAYGSCRPPLVIWGLRFWGLRVQDRRLEVWDLRLLSFVRLEIWELRCGGLRFEKPRYRSRKPLQIQGTDQFLSGGLREEERGASTKKKNNYFEVGYRSKKLVSKQGTDQQNVKSQIRGTDQRIPDLEVAQIICQVRCKRACGPNPQAQIKESRLDKRHRSLCMSLFGGWAYRTWRFWIRTLRLETRASNEPGN